MQDWAPWDIWRLSSQEHALHRHALQSGLYACLLVCAHRQDCLDDHSNRACQRHSRGWWLTLQSSFQSHPAVLYLLLLATCLLTDWPVAFWCSAYDWQAVACLLTLEHFAFFAFKLACYNAVMILSIVRTRSGHPKHLPKKVSKPAS